MTAPQTFAPKTAIMHGTKSFWQSSDKCLYALALFALAWIFVLSGAAWLKLNALGMGFDLGMYEQVIWNTAQGRAFETSAFRYTNNHIGADLIVLEAILAPLYALLPATMTMLVAQVFTVALGALPMYLLARDRLKSNWAGLGIAIAYLLYAPLLYLTLNEFQPRAFALVCVLFAIYYLDKSRFRPYIAFLFISLLTRSDVALFVIMLGVLAFLWRKPWKFSIVPFVMGALWFVVAIFIVVPYFKTDSGGFIYFETYSWLGKTPGEMLVTILTNPLYVLQTVFTPPKIQFLIQVFGPTLPFSLLRPDVLLLAAPTFALNLLSQYNVQSNITRQYAAMLYPVMYASAVLGIAWLAKQKWFAPQKSRAFFVHAAVVWMLGLTIAESFVVGNPVVSQYRKGISPRVETVRGLVASVPAEAGLGISNHVGPFAGQRERFYFFPPHEYYTHNTFEVSQYILVDAQADGNTPGVKVGLEQLQSDPAWELLMQRDGYVLYRKKE
ncbi:MAG: DUF2079 domain-containing protein [Chloroflexi bacterium]|nr:DUF2079 domain-containing protein [Chloroflexota bacterium]